jgi:DNA-binding response OmpR family regulator
MVTAVHEEETGRRALKMGAFDFITKPIDLKYLENSVWYKIVEMTL